MAPEYYPTLGLLLALYTLALHERWLSLVGLGVTLALLIHAVVEKSVATDQGSRHWRCRSSRTR